MGHGTPLTTSGDNACGVAMPHMLEAGISSTRRIAAAWGLPGTDQERPAAQTAPRPNGDTHSLPAAKVARLEPLSADMSTPHSSAKSGVEKTIHDALRAAGLMR
jgi:hypothetical protein